MWLRSPAELSSSSVTNSAPRKSARPEHLELEQGRRVGAECHLVQEVQHHEEHSKADVWILACLETERIAAPIAFHVAKVLGS